MDNEVLKEEKKRKKQISENRRTFGGLCTFKNGFFCFGRGLPLTNCRVNSFFCVKKQQQVQPVLSCGGRQLLNVET